MPVEVLVGVAIVFAFVTGANDGGALIAPGLRVPSLSVLVSLGMLTAALVAYPLLIGSAVAETMLSSIVSPESAGMTALVTGFIVAVVVAGLLAWAGLPTSLTLAVIGGIAGAGLGAGLAVTWTTVGRVLAIGVVAPLAGAALAFGGSWIWWVLRNMPYLLTMRWTHGTAYAAQCVAYGANDGQKMLVLFMAAGLTTGRGTSVEWWMYVVMAAAFAAGAGWGLPRMVRSVGTGILSTRPTHTVTAEFAAAVSVLGSASAGAPVSMTQSVAGGMLGAGVHESYRRVRWQVVRNLALAWALTLPTSFGVAALAAVVVEALEG